MTKTLENIMIVTDVDNTFLGAKGALLGVNCDAVKRFTAAGGLFTFATGRYEPIFAEGVPNCRELMNAPGIFCNGAYIFDIFTRELIASCLLDPRPALEVTRAVLDRFPDINSRLTCADGIFYPREKTDAELPLGKQWYKIIFMGDPERLEEARSFMKELSGARYVFSKSYPDCLELLEAGATKGTMLLTLKKYMSEKLGRPLEVWASGDFENDADMLRKADVAACPSNALPEIKSLSQHVLCSHADGFTGELIEHIMKLYGGN